MAFTGTIEGAQRVVNNLSQLDGRVNDAAFRGVHRGVLGGQSIVRGNARGRPGPRAVTGDFNRSIVGEASRSGMLVSGQIGTNAAQGRRLEFGFVGPDRLGRVYCVDMETEALTPGGWKTAGQMGESEVFFTLNPDTWLSEWQRGQVNVFEGGPFSAVELEGRTLSAVTTPDHRWLVERYYGRQKIWRREWRNTSTLTAACRIPLTAKRGDVPTVTVIEDDIVELVAWFWTEGSYGWSKASDSEAHPTSVSISQSPRVNPKNCERIEALLSRIFGPPGPYRNGHHWNFRDNTVSGSRGYRIDRVAAWLLDGKVAVADKALAPEFLVQLTAAQLGLLVDVSMAADGHTDKQGASRLGQANENRIRSWEMVLALAGIAAKTSVRPGRERHGPMWTTTLLRSDFSSAVGSAKRTDRDHGKLVDTELDSVWCPTTPNGTWLARRKGRIFFTGNSQPPYPYMQRSVAAVEVLVVSEVRAELAKALGR